MTHVKNAEAFARLVDFCTGYGGTYNPGRPTLQIDVLIDQKTKASEALNKVIDAKTQYDTAVNHRRQLFGQMPKLVASIMRTLEASGASEEKLDDARTFAQQVIGSVAKGNTRATVATAAADSTPAPTVPVIAKSKHPLSQMSFAGRADSFAKLVNAVSAEPLYLTNEATLTISSLTEKLKELNAANTEASNARVGWSNSRIERNEVMYRQPESLQNTTRSVKKYVRAIFGPNSEQFAQIKNLRFTKPNK